MLSGCVVFDELDARRDVRRNDDDGQTADWRALVLVIGGAAVMRVAVALFP